MIPVVTMVHRMLNVREHIIQYFDDVRIIYGIKDLFTISMGLNQLVLAKEG